MNILKEITFYMISIVHDQRLFIVMLHPRQLDSFRHWRVAWA